MLSKVFDWLWQPIRRWAVTLWMRDKTARPAEAVRTEDPILLIHIPAGRTKVAIGVIMVMLGILVLRIFYLQYWPEFYKGQGESRFATTINIDGVRGEILDRNGVVLASSQPARDVTIDPQLYRTDYSHQDIKVVAKILKMPLRDLKAKLRQKGRYAILARNQDLATADALEALKYKWLTVHSARERQYPDGYAMAHIVGVCGRNGKGQEGVELAKEKLLAPSPGQRRVLKAKQKAIVELFRIEPRDGESVTLSIDSRVQFAAYEAIKNRVEELDAIAGAVLVADARTGEIIALANVPSYDPNDRSTMNFARMRNRVLTDQFEPGSTMKPFAVCKAMDMGIVKPLTTIQTGPGKLTIGDRTIGDTHDYGLVTTAEIIAKSSNIGTAKIALEIPATTLYETYRALGFGVRPTIEFPGATAGRLREGKRWRPIEQATISYGHGMTVSLLQLVHAYTALARDGSVIDLTLFKRDPDKLPEARPVFTEKTIREMRSMMMDTVKRGGTASVVKVAGYTVAGKTGTAQKVKNGVYTRDVVASFVGIVPATDPRFIVAVMVDEPKKRRYGGGVAGPVFNVVAQAALRTFQVPADDKDEAKQQTTGLLAKAKKRYEDSQKQ